MGKNVTPTVESGLLVAITIIMGLVATFVPLLGMLIEFFCAVPLAVLTARQGAGKGFSALVVTFILLTILISPLPALRLALSFGICGVALGWCVQKNFNAVKTFLTTLIVASAGQVLSLIILLAIMDVNLIEMQIEMLRESFNESFALYESLGVDPKQIAETKSQVEPAIQTMSLLIPTLLMLTALTYSVAVWFTAKWIFPKLQLKLPTFPDFSEWRFPALFMYAAAFGGLGMYWGFTRSWTAIQEISLNVLIISMLVGLTQGLAIVSFLFDRYKVSKLMRRLLYALILLNMFMAQLVAVTGLLDMFFDYRKKFFTKDS